MLEPATTAIFPTPVGKLPIVERLPAIPAAAGVVPVNIAPAALEPTAASPIRDTGDLSPVIFGLMAGRALAFYKPRKGGAIPTVPVALGAAGFTSSYRKRIQKNSLNFCHSEQGLCKVHFAPLMVSLSNHWPLAMTSFDKLRMSGNRAASYFAQAWPQRATGGMLIGTP